MMYDHFDDKIWLLKKYFVLFCKLFCGIQNSEFEDVQYLIMACNNSRYVQHPTVIMAKANVFNTLTC